MLFNSKQAQWQVHNSKRQHDCSPNKIPVYKELKADIAEYLVP